LNKSLNTFSRCFLSTTTREQNKTKKKCTQIYPRAIQKIRSKKLIKREREQRNNSSFVADERYSALFERVLPKTKSAR